VARFAVCCHDAGGTVPPVVALGQALVRRGHHVTVLAQPSVRQRVEAVGCTFTPFSSLGDYDHTKSFDGQLDKIGAAIVGPEVGHDLLRLDADAFVVDANLAGALAAAESAPQPAAVLLHSVYATFTDTWFADLWPLLESGINATRESFGLAAARSWPDAFAPHERLLSVVPRAFDTDIGAPDTMRWFGFLVPDEVPVEEHTEVLVAFSTTHYPEQAAVLERIQEAVGDRALVTSRDRYVPHAALLPNTDVVITHGGMGTVAAALHHGVPLVCIPFDRDQPLNSSRVAALGAGVVLSVDASVDAIRDAVHTVRDDDHYRAAARAVDAGSGGPDAAAADLESLL
jgi:UDP:flavonoid glycosyltransferase YjiC (YdhE family)